MRCVFRREDGRPIRFEAGALVQDCDPATEVSIAVDHEIDLHTERWDGDQGVRAATREELDEQGDARVATELDAHRLLTALALVVADLHSLTPAQIRALIVAKVRSL